MRRWVQHNAAPLLAAGLVLLVWLWFASPFGAGSTGQTVRHLDRVFSMVLPNPVTPLTEVSFCVFDTETTGLSPARDRLVELAAVRVKAGFVLSTHQWLMDPGIPIPKDVQQVHGISNDAVRGQPSFAKIYPAFARQAAGTVLVAHNAPFDLNFLEAEASRAGLPLPPGRVIDTLRLARALYPDLPSHRLADVGRRLQVNTGKLHRAENDALLLANVLLRIIDDLGPEATLNDLYQQAGGWLEFTPLPP